MAQPFFKFKRFTVFHDKCAMKVGTDGVLIGSWTDVSGIKKALDVGTGSGLISLMIAQRAPECKIEAIDIDNDAVIQANYNFGDSPFSDRLKSISCAIQEYKSPEKFDLIISNPPYFNNSLKCPDAQRSKARHTDSLLLDELFIHSKRLISESGKVALILPFEQKQELIETAAEFGFHLIRFAAVKPTPTSQPRRLMAEFSLIPADLKEEEITIEISRHVYDSSYIELTKEFYLNM